MGWWGSWDDCNSCFCTNPCHRCFTEWRYYCSICPACKKCNEPASDKKAPRKFDSRTYYEFDSKTTSGCDCTPEQQCSCTEDQIKEAIKQIELKKQLEEIERQRKEQEAAIKRQLYLDQNTFRLQDIVDNPWYGHPQNILTRMTFKASGIYMKLRQNKRTIQIAPKDSKSTLWVNTSLFNVLSTKSIDCLVPEREYIFELAIKSNYTRDGTFTEVYLISANENEGEIVDRINNITCDFNITAIHKTDHKKLFLIEAHRVGYENEKYYIRYFKERGKRPKPGINRFVFGFKNTKQDILNFGDGYERTNLPDNSWLLCINAWEVYDPEK